MENMDIWKSGWDIRKLSCLFESSFCCQQCRCKVSNLSVKSGLPEIEWKTLLLQWQKKRIWGNCIGQSFYMSEKLSIIFSLSKSRRHLCSCKELSPFVTSVLRVSDESVSRVHRGCNILRRFFPKVVNILTTAAIPRSSFEMNFNRCFSIKSRNSLGPNGHATGKVRFAISSMHIFQRKIQVTWTFTDNYIAVKYINICL